MFNVGPKMQAILENFSDSSSYFPQMLVQKNGKCLPLGIYEKTVSGNKHVILAVSYLLKKPPFASLVKEIHLDRNITVVTTDPKALGNLLKQHLGLNLSRKLISFLMRLL